MRIFVVEPSHESRSSLHALLESQGHDVASFAGSKTARRATSAEPAIFLLGSLGLPTTAASFLDLAEHENYLLGIGRKVLQEAQEAQEKEAPPSGIQTRSDLIETYRTMQRAAAKQSLDSMPSITQSGEMGAADVPLKLAVNA